VYCLLRALRKYDPEYGKKTKQICEAIKREKRLQFSFEDVGRHVEFNPTRYLHLLVRRGLLVSVKDEKNKITGFRRTDSRPPNPSIFSDQPIGLVYFVQKQFRYYLHQHILEQMRLLETRVDLMQLEHRTGSAGNRFGHDAIEGMEQIPNAAGALTDSKGSSWSADMTLLQHSLDLSEMDLEWVSSTEDKLFRNMRGRMYRLASACHLR